MIEDIQKDWPIASDRSILIGDKLSDLAAAKAANIEGLIYEGGNLREFLIPHLNMIAPQPT